MANLIKCDVCGLIGSDYRNFTHIKSFPLVDVTTYAGNKELKEIDTCKECYKKIFKEEK